MPMTRIKLTAQEIACIINAVEEPTRENLQELVKLIDGRNKSGFAMTKADRNRLSAACAEHVLDPGKLQSALETGDPSKVGEVLRDCEREIEGIKSKRAKDLGAIDEALGRVDVAKIGLTPTQRADIEKALKTGRVDPKLLTKMIDDGELDEIVDFIKEIKNENSMALLTERAHSLDHRH